MKDNTKISAAGKSFEELSEKEMETTQGAGDDVNPETTPACVASAVALTATLFTLTHKK